MQIVIEIDDNEYKNIMSASTDYNISLYKEIRKGTPIPKGLEPLITKLIDDAKE